MQESWNKRFFSKRLLTVVLIVCHGVLHAQVPTLHISDRNITACPGTAETNIEITGTPPVSFRYIHDGVTEELRSETKNVINLNMPFAGQYIILSYSNNSDTIEGANEVITVEHYPLNATLSGGGVFCEGQEIKPITVTYEGEPPWEFYYQISDTGPVDQLFSYDTIDTIPLTTNGIVHSRRVIDSRGCTMTFIQNKEIKIVNSPTIDRILGEPSICVGEPTIYLISMSYGPGEDPDDYVYDWDFPAEVETNYNGNTVEDPWRALLTWTQEGEFTIRAQVTQKESDCSSNVDSLQVLVHPMPEVLSLEQVIHCFDISNATLDPADLPENSINWIEFGRNDSPLSVGEGGLYKYMETTSHGCTDTGSYVVYGACEAQLYVPEAFSPNGDGINDELLIFGIYKNLEIKFYRMNGELLYTQRVSNPIETGTSEEFAISNEENDPPWDGKLGGKALPNGVYYWVANYEWIADDNASSTPRIYESKGTVTIIK